MGAVRMALAAKVVVVEATKVGRILWSFHFCTARYSFPNTTQWRTSCLSPSLSASVSFRGSSTPRPSSWSSLRWIMISTYPDRMTVPPWLRSVRTVSDRLEAESQILMKELIGQQFPEVGSLTWQAQVGLQSSTLVCSSKPMESVQKVFPLLYLVLRVRVTSLPILSAMGMLSMKVSIMKPKLRTQSRVLEKQTLVRVRSPSRMTAAVVAPSAQQIFLIEEYSLGVSRVGLKMQAPELWPPTHPSQQLYPMVKVSVTPRRVRSKFWLPRVMRTLSLPSVNSLICSIMVSSFATVTLALPPLPTGTSLTQELADSGKARLKTSSQSLASLVFPQITSPTTAALSTPTMFSSWAPTLRRTTQDPLEPGLQRLTRTVLPALSCALSPVWAPVSFQMRLMQRSLLLTLSLTSALISSALICLQRVLNFSIARRLVAMQSSVTFCLAVPATASWCCRIPNAISIPKIVSSINLALACTTELDPLSLSSEMCLRAAWAYLPKSLTKPLRATLEVKQPVQKEWALSAQGKKSSVLTGQVAASFLMASMQSLGVEYLTVTPYSDLALMYLISLSTFLYHILELVYWKSSPRVWRRLLVLQWLAMDLKQSTNWLDLASMLQSSSVGSSLMGSSLQTSSKQKPGGGLQWQQLTCVNMKVDLSPVYCSGLQTISIAFLSSRAALSWQSMREKKKAWKPIWLKRVAEEEWWPKGSMCQATLGTQLRVSCSHRRPTVIWSIKSSQYILASSDMHQPALMNSICPLATSVFICCFWRSVAWFHQRQRKAISTIENLYSGWSASSLTTVSMVYWTPANCVRMSPPQKQLSTVLSQPTSSWECGMRWTVRAALEGLASWWCVFSISSSWKRSPHCPDATSTPTTSRIA